MEILRNVSVVETALIGAGTRAYLIKRGLWYQGNKQGWSTRVASIVIGLFMFLVGIIGGIFMLSP